MSERIRRIKIPEPPVVEEYTLHGDDNIPWDRTIRVVRDDLIIGGTKMRAIKHLFEAQPYTEEWVYASPSKGYAQIALAITAMQMHKTVTLFVPKASKLSKYTRLAMAYGANVHQVPMGFLKNCQKKAEDYAVFEQAFGHASGRALVPFGANHPAIVDAIARAARMIKPAPKEVWTVLSSGTLSRGLQKAWPNARVIGVQMGHKPTLEELGRAELLYKAPEPFARDAKLMPPFPSCPNYDAKAWQFIVEHATDGALFWNVGA